MISRWIMNWWAFLRRRCRWCRRARWSSLAEGVESAPVALCYYSSPESWDNQLFIAQHNRDRWTHVNGNFLWQWEMWNRKCRRSWHHVIVYPVNTTRWAARRRFLSFDGDLVIIWVVMISVGRFLLCPFGGVRFYVLSKVIFTIEAFAAFGTNLKNKYLCHWWQNSLKDELLPQFCDRCGWRREDLNVPFVWTLLGRWGRRMVSQDYAL